MSQDCPINSGDATVLFASAFFLDFVGSILQVEVLSIASLFLSFFFFPTFVGNPSE